jgi:hypothetical protein
MTKRELLDHLRQHKSPEETQRFEKSRELQTLAPDEQIAISMVEAWASCRPLSVGELHFLAQTIDPEHGDAWNQASGWMAAEEL